MAVAADMKARRGSDTIVAFSSAAESEQPDISVLDAFARQIGLDAVGSQWRPVSRGDAVSLAASALARDLAYGVRQMEDAEAGALASRFVSLFDAAARFFTNRGELGDWMPLTESTFDLGIFVIDRRWLGAMVVQDED
jgi:hypothetical protein